MLLNQVQPNRAHGKQSQAPARPCDPAVDAAQKRHELSSPQSGTPAAQSCSASLTHKELAGSIRPTLMAQPLEAGTFGYQDQGSAGQVT